MSDHQAMRELLPWFVNGSLNEAQQSAVNEHLEDCPVCREDVTDLIRIAARFRTEGQHDLRERSRQAALAFAESLPDQEKQSQQAVRYTGMIAAGIGAVLLVGFIATVTLMPRDSEFRALSRTETVAEGTVIQIVFSEQATAREIRQVLLEDGQRVLSGPTDQGVYRVALDAEIDSRIRLARLRDHEAVIFAESETLR